MKEAAIGTAAAVTAKGAVVVAVVVVGVAAVVVVMAAVVAESGLEGITAVIRVEKTAETEPRVGV